MYLVYIGILFPNKISDFKPHPQKSEKRI